MSDLIMGDEEALRILNRNAGTLNGIYPEYIQTAIHIAKVRLEEAIEREVMGKEAEDR